MQLPEGNVMFRCQAVYYVMYLSWSTGTVFNFFVDFIHSRGKYDLAKFRQAWDQLFTLFECSF